jgi:hypothetical protein
MGAERLARRFGFSAQAIVEGAVSKRVLAAEAAAGSPPRTPDATSQLAASAPGRAEFGRAVVAATVPLVGAPEAMVLAAVRGAALTWKDLVGTGKIFDFKNDARTMRDPRTEHCPLDCDSTVTFCSGTTAVCVRTDVPGNLFYAHIGRWVGFTELALQLGSQFAQLDSTATWDPPDDTTLISLGFSLPDPLSDADLCAALAGLPAAAVRDCPPCTEATTAQVVLSNTPAPTPASGGP